MYGKLDKRFGMGGYNGEQLNVNCPIVSRPELNMLKILPKTLSEFSPIMFFLCSYYTHIMLLGEQRFL